eukprot:TRINITY_DN43440_c0_g1_i1.p1 TRINITY_DN43440_c0_g1~~TRINITY_DN43440_c0_g1_i1.p1  ORF type:complete len:251 (-),score=16.95 TRINITY_DN43440_c0_g1_i1:336-1088(-)
MKRLSFAKVNIFLKITGKRGNFHELISRFCLVPSLYDEMEFTSSRDGFDIEGKFDCSLKENIIYKAYDRLQKKIDSKLLSAFFTSHKVVVSKNIPAGAGLGGGSSNAATFLNMLKEIDSSIKQSDLEEVASSIGSDVMFFLKGFRSANVSGIGEIVEEFSEEPLSFEVFTPPIYCETPKIYKKFRESYYKESTQRSWLDMSSKDVVRGKKVDELNDLYASAVDIYPKLEEYIKDGWFFSGSGSSFFRIKE